MNESIRCLCRYRVTIENEVERGVSGPGRRYQGKILVDGHVNEAVIGTMQTRLYADCQQLNACAPHE